MTGDKIGKKKIPDILPGKIVYQLMAFQMKLSKLFKTGRDAMNQ